MRKIALVLLALFVFAAATGCKDDCCKNGHCPVKK
jgi:hypothetical protein